MAERKSVLLSAARQKHLLEDEDDQLDSVCGHDSNQEHEHHHEHDGNACTCGHDHHHDHHHEHDGNVCTCGHDHHHEHHHEHDGDVCTCGHDHHHEHHHDHDGDVCTCGHDHHHEHHHDHDGDVCTCGHDHHHEHHHEHDHDENRSGKGRGKPKGKQRVYTLRNLGCAHCAAEMQYQISHLAGVSDCVLVYETKQLRVTGKDPDALLPDMRRICASIESAVKIIVPEETPQETTSPLWPLLIGAGCFLAGLLVPIGVPKYALLLLAYIILGWHVLFTAVKNLTKGRVFDENFLMTVATIGAMLIQKYDEAVGVMLFYRIGEYLEDRAVEQSRKQIMSAVDLRPETVQRIEGDTIRTIPAEQADTGDLIQVRPGDRVPLDGEVVEGESRLDTAALTGEPVPVHVGAGDSVLSGCLNTDGVLTLRVTHVLAESMVSRILDSVENAAARKPKIDRFLTRFSRVYTPAVVLIALLTALVPGLLTQNWGHWVYTALTFLVISCPCALVLSVPLAYFAGIGTGSKRGILFKGGISLETLQTVQTVVMDKTGTITKGNFVVQHVVPAVPAGTQAQAGISAPAEAQTATGIQTPADVPATPEANLLAFAAACESASTHPIAQSIRAAAVERSVPMLPVTEIHEQAGEGVQAVIQGKQVLCGNQKLLLRHGVELSDYHGTPGSTEVLLAINGVFAGYIGIADTIKPEAATAVSQLKQLGLRTALLTGDGQQNAEAVAAAVGITDVHARLLPDEKLTTMQTIRNEHGATLFVGDGINDAPVLAGADVGAAMGSGADAALEAADIVFMHADVTAIPRAVRIARDVGRIAKQNIVFALGVKALVMVLGLAQIASMWLAVFADSGVAMLCVLNSLRILRH